MGGLLGLLLAAASAASSLAFSAGVLVCVRLWLAWQRATHSTRWFGFGLLMGFLLALVVLALVLLWLFD